MIKLQNLIRTRPNPFCYLCATEGQSLYDNRIDVLFAAPGEWSLKQCPNKNCGLIWLDPTPLPDDLHLAYQTYFTHDETAEDLPHRREALRDWFYSGYLAAQYVVGTVLGFNRSKKQKYAMFLDDLSPGKLLDVGCGHGLFLNNMRSRGWVVEGVDFDSKAVQNAKRKYNLQVRQGDLHSAHFSDDAFDAVTLSHVIEHVPDPIRLMIEVRRVLKRGGRAVLTTPNSGSWGHERFRPFWFGLDPPRHLHIFSVRTLRELARRSGLEVVQAGSTAADADIFIGGSYSIEKIGNCPALKSDQIGINLVRGGLAAIAQYREHFALKRNPECGEEAVLICRKPGG
jgi:2-polyprenyl-3-methyl-5-hydroxy-6-metoxy-1,4-benzoquinol methylase